MLNAECVSATYSCSWQSDTILALSNTMPTSDLPPHFSHFTLYTALHQLHRYAVKHTKDKNATRCWEIEVNADSRISDSTDQIYSQSFTFGWPALFFSAKDERSTR